MCKGCGLELITKKDHLIFRCTTCRKKKWMKHHDENPWIRHLTSARGRCSSPSHKKFPAYGGAGIKVLISRDEIKYLWIRDGADKMKKPSIDRLDTKGHYEFSNCRFIEAGLNSELGAMQCKVKSLKEIIQGQDEIIESWKSKYFKLRTELDETLSNFRNRRTGV